MKMPKSEHKPPKSPAYGRDIHSAADKQVRTKGEGAQSHSGGKVKKESK
jgi:hypothetical protein